MDSCELYFLQSDHFEALTKFLTDEIHKNYLFQIMKPNPSNALKDSCSVNDKLREENYNLQVEYGV